MVFHPEMGFGFADTNVCIEAWLGSGHWHRPRRRGGCSLLQYFVLEIRATGGRNIDSEVKAMKRNVRYSSREQYDSNRYQEQKCFLSLWVMYLQGSSALATQIHPHHTPGMPTICLNAATPRGRK